MQILKPRAKDGVSPRQYPSKNFNITIKRRLVAGVQ